MKRITVPLVLLVPTVLTTIVEANPDCKVPGPPFIDPFITSITNPVCIEFGTDLPPIPPDFFGPGSDPFNGQVCYLGEPLGLTQFGTFGNADTLVLRNFDPFDRCVIPSATPTTIPIEIVELDLKSSAPITVTFNGGQNPELWDIRLNPSDLVPSPPGQLNATKDHCNGGNYDSVLPVQPKFTFTNVLNPPNEIIFDTGNVPGFPPFDIITPPSPWVTEFVGPLVPTNPICSDFHAGIQDSNPTIDCDCNTNNVHDSCDVEGGSPDVNLNGIPDECEPNPIPVPAVSEWGLVVLAVLTTTLGTLIVGRRSNRLAL
jgi:hypothetical protein